MKSFRAILLLSTALFAIPALAQEPAAAPQVSNPLAQRENALAPVLSWMQATGIKLIYLGGEGGIRGYLSEGANGNMQTAYLTPDGEHIISGLMFSEGGDNVTGWQISQMRARFAKAAEQFGGSDAKGDNKLPDVPVLPSEPAPATAKAPASPDDLPPVLLWMQRTGIKLTYIGDEGGLRGYLSEGAKGKMQTVYATPDGKNVVAGLLVKRGGDNVTGVQIGEMRARFSAAQSQFGTPAGEGATSVAKPGEVSVKPEADKDEASKKTDVDKPAAAASEAAPAVKVPETSVDAPKTEQAAPAAVVTPEIPATAPAATTPAAQQSSGLALPTATAPASGAIGNPSERWISKVDKDAFLKAASESRYFEVGSRSAPITVWEIGDPQCPFCHAAWDYLRPLVYDKKVKVRVVLIAALNGSEPLAREILASAVPGRRWIDSDAGRNLKVETDPNSDVWKDTEGFLGSNMEFARQFGVDRTPFLGYVGFDGQFYSALGLPSDLPSFMDAGLAK
jgi:protein-disulfide isomerase